MDQDTWNPINALFAALRARDFGTLSSLLEAGVDVNVQLNNDGLLHVLAAVVRDPVLALEAFERLARYKPDVNQRSAARGGATPLHVAVMNNSVLIDPLVRAGADVNAVLSSESPISALQMAAPRALNGPNEFTAVTKMLDYGADVNFLMPEGDTVLAMLNHEKFHPAFTLRILQAMTTANINTYVEGRSITWWLLAAAWGPHQSLNRLPPQNRNVRIYCIWTALMRGGRIAAAAVESVPPGLLRAALTGDMAGTDEALKRRATAGPREAHSGGGTVRSELPLSFIAAGNGYVEVVRKLLGAGAPCILADDLSDVPITLLHVAAARGDVAMYDMLVGQFKSLFKESWEWTTTPLHVAAYANQAEMVKRIIATSQEFDQVDSEASVTPLYYAAARGYADIVTILLDAGASVRVTAYQSALSASIEARQRDVARLLIARGHPVAAQNDERSPLEIAASVEDLVLVDALLAAGAEVRANDVRAAVAAGDVTVAARVFNVRRSTIVMIAEEFSELISVCSNHPMLCLLLSHKDMLEARDRFGQTVLYKHQFRGTLTRALLEAGCDPNVVDRTGRSPLDIAIAEKSSDAVRLFILYGASLHRANFAIVNEALASIHTYFDSVPWGPSTHELYPCPVRGVVRTVMGLHMQPMLPNGDASAWFSLPLEILLEVMSLFALHWRNSIPRTISARPATPTAVVTHPHPWSVEYEEVTGDGNTGQLDVAAAQQGDEAYWDIGDSRALEDFLGDGHNEESSLAMNAL